MADWSKLVEGFQQGADFSQNFRARKQIEKARDQALESGEYGLQAKRAFRRVRDPMTEGALGALDPNSVQDYQGLEDPFAIQLFRWAKTKMRRKKRALDVGEGMTAAGGAPNPSTLGQPPDMGAVPTAEAGAMSYGLGGPRPDDEAPMPPEYADGGSVESEDEKAKRRAREYRERTPGRVERATESVEGADRTAKPPPKEPGRLDNVRRAINMENPAGGSRVGNALRGVGRAAGKGAATVALVAPLANQLDENADQRYAQRFGWEGDNPNEGDPSVGGYLKYLGKRALGYASDVGDMATMGLAHHAYRDDAPAEPAEPVGDSEPLPASTDDTNRGMGYATGSVSTGATSRRPQAVAPQPEIVDFSDLDTTHADIPNMQVGDWVKYRARMVDAARQSGDPAAVSQANDMVTKMQMDGFQAYGQQGLALQAAGNIHGAMSAYRAAFQYFPNGNDVEFGLHKDRRTGRQQIVGFGKSEQDGKVIPGSEIVMDPERTAVLLENFKKPEAWRMWTKDWRDDQFKERKYQEVEKPLAQAQADYMATNADANVLRAENAALRGGAAGSAGAAANMRNAEHVFRERVQMLGMTDEAQSDFLANVMSQIKAANPTTPDNAIVQAVMQSVRDGTLEQRLQKMGIAAPATPSTAPPTGGASPAPRRAIPGARDPSISPYVSDEAAADIQSRYGNPYAGTDEDNDAPAL